MGTWCEDICTFMVIFRRILLRMRDVSDKSCRENQHKHFMFNNVFPKIVLFMTYRKKYIVEPDRPQMTIKYDTCAFHTA
jgi:hypothetical protein